MGKSIKISKKTTEEIADYLHELYQDNQWRKGTTKKNDKYLDDLSAIYELLRFAIEES
jgi:hypothetical protein